MEPIVDTASCFFSWRNQSSCIASSRLLIVLSKLLFWVLQQRSPRDASKMGRTNTHLLNKSDYRCTCDGCGEQVEKLLYCPCRLVKYGMVLLPRLPRSGGVGDVDMYMVYSIAVCVMRLHVCLFYCYNQVWYNTIPPYRSSLRRSADDTVNANHISIHKVRGFHYLLHSRADNFVTQPHP